MELVFVSYHLFNFFSYPRFVALWNTNWFYRHTLVLGQEEDQATREMQERGAGEGKGGGRGRGGEGVRTGEGEG